MTEESTTPRNTKTLRHERLIASAESVKTSNSLAHQITLHLIENNVTEDYLKENIRFITPENYEDITVERALSNICGYPLCSVNLTHQYEKQTFIIRYNKVYDVTQRRNFCSDICYEASEIIHWQIPATPLYLRMSDLEIRNFTLQIPDRSSLVGLYGKFVNIMGSGFEDELLKKNDMKSISNTISLLDTGLNTIPTSNQNIDSRIEPAAQGINLMNAEVRSIDSNVSNEDISASLDITKLRVSKPINYQKPDRSDAFAEASNRSQCDKNEKSTSEVLNNKTVTAHSKGQRKIDIQDNFKHNEKESKINFIIEIEQSMRQWMTFESLRFILGDKYVGGMLEELEKTWQNHDNLSGVEAKSTYLMLLKKLDVEKLKEERNNSVKSAEQKLLKKSVEEQSIKVKAFYEGKEEFLVGEEEGEERKRKRGDDDATLPRVDSCQQIAWRREILFEKLSKPFAFLSCELSLDEGQTKNLLKHLVWSFDLRPQNISLKVHQWSFVALIIIKMLSVRYIVIHEALNSAAGSRLLSAQLEKLELDSLYLDRVMAYLTEIAYIVGKTVGPFDETGKPGQSNLNEPSEATKEAVRSNSGNKDVQQHFTQAGELD